MQDKSLMFYMIRSELEDAVGVENVSTKEIERAVYSVDYFWLSRKWQDAGEQGPMPDIIVRPGTTEEVSKVMKIANYYKIPVTTWGGGSGSQGGALPVAGGILLDIKRLDKLIDLNTEAGYVTCETGMIFATLEDLVNEKGYSVMHLPSCMTCCTVGGALAHNGIGILSTKYGKMDDMCLSLEVVQHPARAEAFLRPQPDPLLRRLRGDSRHHDQGQVQDRQAARDPHSPCVPVLRHPCGLSGLPGHRAGGEALHRASV